MLILAMLDAHAACLVGFFFPSLCLPVFFPTENAKE